MIVKDKIGTVVELQGAVAIVLCHENGRTDRVQARNPLGASPGDKVRVVGDPTDVLHSPALCWGAPIFGLVLGIILGQIAGAKLEHGPDPLLLSAILGLAFFVGSMVIVRVGGRAVPGADDGARIAEILLPSQE